MWITTAAEARELDQRTSSEHGIRAADLMEEAGRAVYRIAQKYLGKRRTIAVFCGPGNNGGDGFVVARVAHLAGADVQCFLTVPPEKLSELTQERYNSLLSVGIVPLLTSDPNSAEALESLKTKEVIVDAILGTGGSGTLRAPLDEVIGKINESGVPVISIDLPSGIESDTGNALGASVKATETVAIGWPKRAHFQGDGILSTGILTVEPINFPKSLRSRPTGARLIRKEYARKLLHARARNAHKVTSGRVLIVAGSQRFPGAAVLAALGALRGGAGLVTMASTPEVCRSVLVHCPEAILLPCLKGRESVSPELAGEILQMQDQFDSAVFGPGLGDSADVAEFFKQLLPKWKVPSVYDANALPYVAGNLPSDAPAVLTPHPGEMARLLGKTVREIQSNRFETASEAAETLAATVVLKGVYTIVNSPDRIICVNPTGNPGMATGGSGDVLAGLIGALLNTGLDLHDAATLATYLHGLAGDICAETIGTIGFTASELSKAIPQARAKLDSV